MTTDRDKIKHEIWMNRLLMEILDNKYLATNCFFKGGTCAAMLGYLDRFSASLDLDLREGVDKNIFYRQLITIFNNLGLEIKDESSVALQFFLKYPADKNSRNTLKVEFLDNYYKENCYRTFYLPNIERTASCQTIETMFSHKLVAPVDRYRKNKSIAGRDIYDIHYFFSQGYCYNKNLIEERTGASCKDYFTELGDFIDKKITKKIIEEDLNVLLDYDKFKIARKHLKHETLRFIRGTYK